MKGFLIIMSFLFIGLSVLPCQDTYIRQGNQTLLSEKSDVQNHIGDDCSPFCACQCCQIQITEFEEMAVFEPLHADVHQAYFSYQNPIGIELNRALFQPPRV